MVPLSSLATITPGFPFKSKNFSDSGFPVVKIGNIKPSHVELDGGDRIPVDQIGGLERFLLHDGDIVVAIAGKTLGKTGRVRLSEPAYLNQGIAKLSSKAGPEFGDFLYTLISQPEFRAQMAARSNGYEIIHITRGALGNILVAEFDADQQLQIGRIARAIDDKIELNRRRNATLEAVVHSLFQAWFVDFEPVRAKAAGRVPSGLDAETAALFPCEFENNAPIPKGWKNGRLRDVCVQRRESVPFTKIKPEMPYLGLGDMARKSIVLDSWSTSAEVRSIKSRLEKGDILFGRLRPYSHKVGVAPLNGLCSADILVVRPKQPEQFGFALCVLNSDELIAYASLLAKGSFRPRVDWKDLADYPLLVPPLEIQKYFSALVEKAVAEIHSNIYNTHALLQLRAELLPPLLSGRLQVPEAEAILKSASLIDEVR